MDDEAGGDEADVIGESEDLFGITEIFNGSSPNSNNLPPEFGSQYNILHLETNSFL